MLPIVLALLLAGADPASTGGPPPKPVNAQAMFDAASAAADAGRCDEAIAGFTSLEARASVQQAPKVLAVVRLRKGGCLLQLSQLAAAEAAYHAGLPIVQDDLAIYRADVAAAHIGLGRIAYAGYDYVAAREQFEMARSIVAAADRFETSLWLARATMFDEGPAALSYADDALAAATALADTPKVTLSDLRTLRARALLNHGEQPAAYAELKKALAAQGGLTTRVNVHELVTRADLALAALLTGDTDSARKYLAYTGAGRTGQTPFASAAVMAPPSCGGEADLRPDDVVIVEFGIRDDGSVSSVSPIYASRLGPVAMTFARAVADWSWRPKDLKDIGPLFRAVTRVELRCSLSFKHPSIRELLRADLQGWLTSQQVSGIPDGDRAAAMIAGLRTELARRQAAGETVGLIPPLVALGDNPVLPVKDRREWMRQAHDIAAAAHAPVAARLYLEVDQPGEIGDSYAAAGKYRGHLRELLAQPDIAHDARSAAALRLLISEARFRAPAPPDAAALLQQVTADTGLSAHDPLRINALVRLASLQAKAGDVAAARVSYQNTGLDAQQCALVDAKPVLQAANAGSNRFPQEALRWGFEGWVKTEYDIEADGKTASQRAVIAYPPFVFRNAAVEIAKGMRFQQSYRPEGATGCSGAQQNINFRIGAQIAR